MVVSSAKTHDTFPLPQEIDSDINSLEFSSLEADYTHMRRKTKKHYSNKSSKKSHGKKRKSKKSSKKGRKKCKDSHRGYDDDDDDHQYYDESDDDDDDDDNHSNQDGDDESESEDKHCPCDDDIYECPDGSFVSRNETNNCQFVDCPKPTTNETDNSGEITLFDQRMHTFYSLSSSSPHRKYAGWIAVLGLLAVAVSWF